jgi:hypothetical protein
MLFFHFSNQKKESPEVTKRVFKIVFYFLLTVVIGYVVITWLVFGHL